MIPEFEECSCSLNLLERHCRTLDNHCFHFPRKSEFWGSSSPPHFLETHYAVNLLQVQVCWSQCLSYIHQREISGLTEGYLLGGLYRREDLCDSNVKGLSCTDTMFRHNVLNCRFHVFSIPFVLCNTVCKGLDKVIYDFLWQHWTVGEPTSLAQVVKACGV